LIGNFFLDYKHMPVRKTENRIPANFQASDLGEAVVAADGRCVLVSFVTAPIVVARDNVYVLFVTDPVLAGKAQSFEWTFTENGGGTRVDTTKQSETIYQPLTTGTLLVAVRVLDTGGVEQATLSIKQQIVSPSEVLEALITQAQNSPGPGVGDPSVIRELVNEHCAYYHQVALQKPEDDDAFRNFVFSMAMSGANRHSSAERRKHLADLATALNEQPEDFARLTCIGLGVCGIRFALLAMVLPQTPGGAPIMPWKELPERAGKRTFEDEQLRQSLITLSEDSRIDLFNVVRFPKSNIAACGRILESLRDRYFGGTRFQDVITGMSGTRAYWIKRHFLEGPLAKE
jgi:hypothetical protein